MFSINYFLNNYEKISWITIVIRIYFCSNGIAGSAVCSYNLSAINTAFNGPFKSKENTSEWTRVTPIQGQYPGRCENQLSFDSSKY